MFSAWLQVTPFLIPYLTLAHIHADPPTVALNAVTESGVTHPESPGTVSLGLFIQFTSELSLLWAIHKDSGASQEGTEQPLTTLPANISCQQNP